MRNNTYGDKVKDPRPKPVETRQTSSSCNSCGRPLKPTAKFCGKVWIKAVAVITIIEKRQITIIGINKG